MIHHYYLVDSIEITNSFFSQKKKQNNETKNKNLLDVDNDNVVREQSHYIDLQVFSLHH